MAVMRTSGFAYDSDKGWTGDKDDFHEPYLNGNTDYTRPDIHDLEATTILLPVETQFGEVTNVTAIITNIGTFLQSTDFTLTDGDKTFTGTTGTLDIFEKKSFIFEWDTTDVEKGTHTWTLTIGDDENNDNTETSKSTFVIADGDRDIALTKIKLGGPGGTEVAWWERGNIQTSIANQGIVQIKDVRYLTTSDENGDIINTRSTISTLNVGNTILRTATMVIEGDVPAGNYTITSTVPVQPSETDIEDNEVSFVIQLVETTDRPLPPYHKFTTYNNLKIHLEHIIDPFVNQSGEKIAGDPNGDMDKSSLVIETDRIPDGVTVEILDDETWKVKSTGHTSNSFIYWRVLDDEGNQSNRAYTNLRFVFAEPPDPTPPDPDPPADTVPPILSLNGSSEITIIKDTTYVELGATCFDDKDGQIDDRVVITGNVDETTLGEYILKYDCSDTSDNDAVQLSRTVNVVEDPNPPQDPPSDIIGEIRIHLAAIDVLLDSIDQGDGFEDRYNDEVAAHDVTKGELADVTEEKNIAVKLLDDIRNLLANLFN